MTSNSQHRDTGIDAMRGLAMWMVVVSHFALWFYTDAPERYWLSLPGQMIAMPVFFFFSARLHRNTSWHSLGKRVLRFALITIAGTALLDVARQIPLSQALEPENLFFWFFVAMIIFESIGTITMHIIKHIETTVWRYITALALIFMVQIIFITAYRSAPETPVVPLFDLRNIWLCYAMGLLCSAMPGLAQSLRNTPVFICAVIMLAGAFILTTTTGDRLFIIGTIATVIVSCRLSEWMQSILFIAIVGRQSLWVYIIHPFLLTLLYHIVNQYLTITSHHVWITYMVCMTGAAMMCPAIAYPVDRFILWRKKRTFAKS